MKYRLLIFLIIIVTLARAQSSEGFIIKVDGDKIYTNLHHPTIKVSDVLTIVSNGESIAQIEITAIPGTYSVGRLLGNASMPLVEKMTVRKDENYQPGDGNISTPAVTENAPIQSVPQENIAPPVSQSFSAPVQPVETPVPQNNYSQPVNESVPVQVNPVETSVQQPNSPPMNNFVPAQPEVRTNFQNNNQQPVNSDGKVPIMIAPADVNFPQGINNMVVGTNGDTGYIGDYVAAVLSEQLLKCDKIQLLDPATAQEMGLRARYKIKVTMLKPDVESVSNDIPAGGVLRLVQSISQNNVGTPPPIQQAVPDNVNTKKVKVRINIIVNIIDSQTGAILPQTFSAAGKGSGTLQLSLANSTTGNLNINQGADFSQTAIGQAIENAFKKIGSDLNNYFNNQLNNYFNNQLNN